MHLLLLAIFGIAFLCGALGLLAQAIFALVTKVMGVIHGRRY